MSKSQLLFLDTNIFIYFFEGENQHSPKVKKIFSQLATNQNRAITSIITQIELLSLSDSGEQAQLLLDLLLETPNLKIFDLGFEIANLAARIRRNYRFQIPDSIQLATALHCQADVFITNDRRLAKFPEIKIELL